MSEPLVALYIFVLSCFIGYWVIWGVTPSLHTPLVALTNAISVIVIIGALLVGLSTGKALAAAADLPLVGVEAEGWVKDLLRRLSGSLPLDTDPCQEIVAGTRVFIEQFVTPVLAVDPDR